MIKILCYGDSNTWGAVSGDTSKRYDLRYTKVLQSLLGSDFEVIEEGQSSRTTNLDDFKLSKGNRNGYKYFIPCLCSHNPIDYVVIILGINDLKTKFNRSLDEIYKALEENYILPFKTYLKESLSKIPQIIIVAPNIITKDVCINFSEHYNEESVEKSKDFNKVYKRLAKNNNCLFIDNENLIAGIDGVHLTIESHKILAEKLYNLIKKEEDKK